MDEVIEPCLCLSASIQPRHRHLPERSPWVTLSPRLSSRPFRSLAGHRALYGQQQQSSIRWALQPHTHHKIAPLEPLQALTSHRVEPFSFLLRELLALFSTLFSLSMPPTTNTTTTTHTHNLISGCWKMLHSIAWRGYRERPCRLGFISI